MFKKFTFSACILLTVVCARGICGAADSILNFKQMGYDKIRGFVFKVEKPDNSFDTLGLFSSNIIIRFNGMNRMQWQALTKRGGVYAIPDDRLDHSYTGITSDDSELFIHPAREQYKILQFCPYPYFKKVKHFGDSWNWDLTIGGTWAIDSLYPVRNSNAVFSTEYHLEDTVRIATPMGKIPAYRVNATSRSKFGTSHASYLINNDYGLVYFNIECTNGQTFKFQLIDTIEEKDARIIYPSLFYMLDRCINPNLPKH